jgi:hypothetical protein
MRAGLYSSVLLLALATNAQAEGFRYNYTLVSGEIPPNWTQAVPVYGDWVDVNGPYSCSNWSPFPSTVGKGLVFTQTANDCSQDQKRTVQARIKNNVTNEIKNSGALGSENRTIVASDHRESIGTLENWLGITPTYTSWIDTNALYGCTAWSPSPATYSVSTNFTQTSNTCKTDQERQRQEREQEKFTSEIRNNGEPVTEEQTLTGKTATRPYSVTLGAWTVVGEPYQCSNWSPAVTTIGKGIKFTQNATDCKLNQTRTRAESYKDHKTGQTVQVSTPNENRTLTNQPNSQESTGTLEQWLATTPTYTAWVNTSALNACSNWSPTGASKSATVTFAQTATNCTTDQARNRQDREKEQNTGEIRDKGVPVAEAQTLTAQSATRSYTVTLGAWTNSGVKYACSNWSPSPTTVTVGQGFTQTATDCKQDQVRTRAESYIDHKSGSTVAVTVAGEAQTLTGQSNTQLATGTKETWVASTPTYTAWASVAAPYNCANWTPLGSAYSEITQFTQTATNCSVDQTRSRQNRETETTTGAIRNSGAPVSEAQTISGQTNTRAYLEDFAPWVWGGESYNCTNWSPDPSTVTTGTAFTQTATNCSRDQVRGRMGKYMLNGTWTPDPADPYRIESKTLGGQSSTRGATGTKETWAATTPIYTAWANSSGLYSCGAYAPAPSAYTTATQFTQTAYCYVNQSRTRQDRQYETTTGAIRNVGAPVAEAQTLGGQPTSRTYLMDFSGWSWAGDYYGCGGWAPAASDYNQGQAFTQTAYCYRNQQRGAAGYTWGGSSWVPDPAVPYRTETTAYAGQPIYQTAYGTKITTQTLYSPPNYMIRCTRTWETNSCILSWGGINNIGDFGVFNPAGRYLDVGGYRYTAGGLQSRWSDADMDEDLYSITQTKL